MCNAISDGVVSSAVADATALRVVPAPWA